MEENQLLQGSGMEIAIHVDAAQCPFHGIDFAVLIAVQLLKMIMRQIQRLGMGDAR